MVNKTTTESITIGFYPNDVTPSIAASPWELTITFKENKAQTDNAYKVADYQLNAVFYENIFPNASKSEFTYTADPLAEIEIHGERTNGFSCSATGLAMVNGSSVEFKNLKVVAFGLLESDQFPANQIYDECKLDSR